MSQDRDQWRAPVNTINETSGSIVEFLDYLSDGQLVNKDSDPCRWSQSELKF